LGGLSHATSEMATAMDAAGYDIILIETVGVGQSEIEIARLAHTILLVENPGTGDDIQAIKAGILEIANVISINKADRPGVEQTEQALRSNLDLNPASQGNIHHFMGSEWPAGLLQPVPTPAWNVPLIRSIATEGTGIDSIIKALRDHLEYLKSSGQWQVQQNKRLRRDLESLIREVLFQTWLSRMNPDEYDRALDRLFTRTVSPFHLAEELIVSDFANKTPSIHLK
jgi:LAO/AO transport system kinase